MKASQTTDEHVDVHDLGLVGAQKELFNAIIATRTPVIVIFVVSKSVAEDYSLNRTLRVAWNARQVLANRPTESGAVIGQFYQLNVLVWPLSRVSFGDVNPST